MLITVRQYSLGGLVTLAFNTETSHRTFTAIVLPTTFLTRPIVSELLKLRFLHFGGPYKVGALDGIFVPDRGVTIALVPIDTKNTVAQNAPSSWSVFAIAYCPDVCGRDRALCASRETMSSVRLHCPCALYS